MAEENQVMKEPQQVKQVTKEPRGEAAQPQRVTTKDPRKVETGKRLAAINCKKREVKKREEQAQFERIGVNQYYGIGAFIALGVIGGVGYYIYRTKKGGQTSNPQQNNPKPHPQVMTVQLQTNKFEMD